MPGREGPRHELIKSPMDGGREEGGPERGLGCASQSVLHPLGALVARENLNI